MTLEFPILASFVVYLILIMAIGLLAFFRTRNQHDYILGGRSLGPCVTALSAGASDMSGWLLLGLPGAVYLAGMGEIWIGIGLLVGAYCNWFFVSSRLRRYSHRSGNALTLPDFFENRFRDGRRALRIISALVILLFFTFYAASGLVGGAILFENSFGMDYSTALIVGTVIIVSYTFLGGFLAVSWTDALQASIMFLALMLAPALVTMEVGGPAELVGSMREINPANTSMLAGTSVVGIFSLLAWGLGYFGQPHILARFMAIQDPKQLPAARRIAMSWMFLVLAGSVLTGMAGMVYFSEAPLANPETVFLALSRELFNPWVAGLIAAAILSAIMSTIDSQLLVSSSVVSEDFYRIFVRPGASQRELLLVSRLAVLVIALVALFIASDRNSRVLDLVSYAWAGFGASFGPVILFSLFWRKMTAAAALAGMLTGAMTVVIWAKFNGGLFDLYEMIPGFVFATLAIVISGLVRPQRQDAVLSEFADVAGFDAS